MNVNTYMLFTLKISTATEILFRRMVNIIKGLPWLEKKNIHCLSSIPYRWGTKKKFMNSRRNNSKYF